MAQKTRREMLRDIMAMTLAGAGCTALPALADTRFFAGPSLDALARAKGLGFGTCLGTKAGPHATKLEGTHASSFESARMRALAAEECGIIVPENELKWYALKPSDHAFAFDRADRIAAWTGKTRLALRGHTLLWNIERWMQDWVKHYDFGPHPAAACEAMLRTHINTVCGRYPQIFSWDVVNETIDPRTGEMRDTVFTRAMGPELIDFAFHTAHAAAPQARLVYNDFMNWSRGDGVHQKGVLKLLERLRKNNVPVDALGIQSHIGTGNTGAPGFAPVDEEAWRGFLDEVTAMGYDLIITELDIGDSQLPGTVARRDAEIAGYVQGYLDLMLSYRQLRYVMVWGLSDKYSWLMNFNPRADGAIKRPCPYDADLKPKPMRAAIAAAFRAAPARPQLPALQKL